MSLNPEQTERYKRHLLLREVGGQGQQRLLSARVLVVGAGGIGAPVLQYLAAAGVGTIGIADDDVVSLSNLQRQVIYRTEDVGALKAEAAQAALARLSPQTHVRAHQMKMDAANAASVARDYDLIVEGVDNFETRFVLNRAAIALETPLVSAAVGRFEGQLSTFKPYEAPGVLPCYRCLVPEAPPATDQINCAEEGVLGAVTGVVGTLAAMEVLKAILGVGDALAGRLLIYDGLAASTRTVVLTHDPACPECRALKEKHAHAAE